MTEMKTAVVTGATHGIGKEIARGLVKLGWNVVLVGRDAEKTQRVVNELQALNPQARLSSKLADLSRPAQVQQLATELSRELPKLDVLINNAGGYFAERELTPEGFEKTFALNHLGYFVLSEGLIPLLEKSAPSRIVNMSSGAHWGAAIELDDLQFEKRPWRSGWAAYAASKLANILFTVELRKRLDGKNITVNCMHPGFVASGFGHNNSGWLSRMFVMMQKVFARSSEKGAETAVYLATSDEVKNVTGKYFVDLKPRMTSKTAKDEKLARQLWDTTQAVLSRALSRSAA